MANSNKLFDTNVNITADEFLLDESLLAEAEDSSISEEAEADIDIAEMIEAVAQYLDSVEQSSTIPGLDENNNNNQNVSVHALGESNVNTENTPPKKKRGRKPKDQSESKPQKILYLLGNEVPETLHDKIQWGITTNGNRSLVGTLTTINNEKQNKQRVFQSSYWNSNYKLVYEHELPAKPVKKEDYVRLIIENDVCTIDGKSVIRMSAYRRKHQKQRLNDATIAANHPLLDPANEVKEFANKKIKAVFISSGQSVPSDVKPCWTKCIPSNQDLKGFVVINEKKYLVINLATWNKTKRWFTQDGRELERFEYDNLVRKGKYFFLKEIKDNNTVLTPLISISGLKARKRSMRDQDIKEVVVLGLSEDVLSSLTDNYDNYIDLLDDKTLVFALSGIPIPQGLRIVWKKKRDDKNASFGYAYLPENEKIRAKITTGYHYKNNFRLLYNDLTNENYVSPKDCMKINPNFKPLSLDGQEVITHTIWKTRRAKFIKANPDLKYSINKVKKPKISKQDDLAEEAEIQQTQQPSPPVSVAQTPHTFFFTPNQLQQLSLLMQQAQLLAKRLDDVESILSLDSKQIHPTIAMFEASRLIKEITESQTNILRMAIQVNQLSIEQKQTFNYNGGFK